MKAANGRETISESTTKFGITDDSKLKGNMRTEGKRKGERKKIGNIIFFNFCILTFTGKMFPRYKVKVGFL
jgi:hypothetical protein